MSQLEAPLEARKGKEADSALENLEPPEATGPVNCSPVRCGASGLQKSKRMNWCCFKPSSL